MLYAMSDLHGHWQQYREMLQKIHFSQADTLYILGDVMDRGPEPMKILLDMMQRDNIYFILGNHDALALQLLKGKVGKPFVRFGSYPREENGLPGALTWQVIHLDGTTATLLCTEVIDADHQAQSVELILTEKEAAALKESMLPTVSDLAGMELTCGASPYALARGVPHETDGRSWWWLRDGSLVSAGGSVIKSAAEISAGVRPMVRVSLEDALWTQGEGTAENPYQ